MDLPHGSACHTWISPDRELLVEFESDGEAWRSERDEAQIEAVRAMLTGGRPRLTTHHPSLITNRSLLTAHHSSLITRHSSLITHLSSLITQHSSRID